MKVYHVPHKLLCPLRVQMSDDRIVSTLQIRNEEGYPFYWELISTETADRLIVDLKMEVLLELPDTPEEQMLP